VTKDGAPCYVLCCWGARREEGAAQLRQRPWARYFKTATEVNITEKRKVELRHLNPARFERGRKGLDRHSKTRLGDSSNFESSLDP